MLPVEKGSGMRGVGVVGGGKVWAGLKGAKKCQKKSKPQKNLGPLGASDVKKPLLRNRSGPGTESGGGNIGPEAR